MVNLDAVDRDIIKLEQKFKRLAEQARKERAKTEGGKTKSDGQYALADKYSDYDKPITSKDIEILRSMGRKSVNDFKTEDLEKAQKWAYKFYQQLGEKSPFFRAWFGDWRAYDISPANVVSFAYGENPKIDYNKRDVKCGELNADIVVDGTIIEDSLSYAKKNSDEKQISKLLGKVDEILSKGTLLDTRISEKSSGNKKGSTQFMHYLYTPISINGAPFIAKLSVEEYDLIGKNRAYNLQRIELSDVSRAQYSQLIAENREKYAYTSDALSIAQLFELVKQKDKNFSPNPVNEHLLNEDGTPKKFYHQTENVFTEFDVKRKGAGSSDFETPFGIFLKESDRDIGLKGKIQMQLYAKMVNPLVVNDRAELVKIISELSNDYAKFYNKSKEIDKEYSQKHEEAIKAFQEFIIRNSQSPNRKSRQELYQDAEFIKVFEAEDNIVDEWQEENRKNDLKAKEALTKVLRENNFDGVILKKDVGSFGRSTEAYIVLDNTQVKSATSNIGTFDKTEGDIQYSLPDVDKKQKSVYNEFNTQAMIWANSAGTQVGDTKIFNRNGRGFVLLESTEDGYIELASGNYKELKELEQQYIEPNDGVYVYSKIVRNAKNRNTASDSVAKDGGEYEQSNRPFRGKELQNNTARNNEHLQSSDKGISNSEADSINEPAYSLPDDSYNIPEIARGKNAKELYEMSQRGEISTDDALKVLAKEHGRMPEGESPKVDVTVPKKVSEKQGVRRFARTALESGHLTEGMSEEAKKEILDGALNYKILSNKMLVNMANNEISKDISGAIFQGLSLKCRRKQLIGL